MRSGCFAVILGVLASLGGSAHAASHPVTVFLQRNGRVVSDDVTIPRFGGGDRAWNSIVGCVRDHFAPFNVDVVDQQPARGDHITAVVGGLASQLGLDDRWTNGVGPHTGRVIPNAIVFVFSRVGTGERDVANLCAVTAHEVAHSLGLDHSYKCGDIMSYFLDRCGTRKFLDVSAPCGEESARKCAGGERTQNSYRRLGALVGFRDRATAPEPEPEPVEVDPTDDADWDAAGDDAGDDRGAYQEPYPEPARADRYRGYEPQPADPYDEDDAAGDAAADPPPQQAPRHSCGRRHRRR